jgi:hypothetical protein
MFLEILKPNQRFLPETLRSGLLTFCLVNLNHVSLLNLENSGRRYILKKNSVSFGSTFLIAKIMYLFTIPDIG